MKTTFYVVVLLLDVLVTPTPNTCEQKVALLEKMRVICKDIISEYDIMRDDNKRLVQENKELRKAIRRIGILVKRLKRLNEEEAK